MITDRNLARKRLTHVIPFERFLGLLAEGTPNVHAGLGYGAPVVTEVSDFGYGSFSLVAGDMLACTDFFTSAHADVTKDIGVRVRWVENVASPAATDAVTFIVLYDQADLGESMVEPATALDTTIAAHVPGETTGLRMRRTSRGIINADSLDAAAKNGVLGWRIESDAITTYGAAEVGFLGLEIDYMPHTYMNSSETVLTHAASGNSES